MAPCFSAILKTATEFIEVFTYPSLSTVEDGLGAPSDRLPVDAGIGALLTVEAIPTRAAVEIVVAVPSLDPVVAQARMALLRALTEGMRGDIGQAEPALPSLACIRVLNLPPSRRSFSAEVPPSRPRQKPGR